jgi:hypothetical protein
MNATIQHEHTTQLLPALDATLELTKLARAVPYCRQLAVGAEEFVRGVLMPAMQNHLKGKEPADDILAGLEAVQADLEYALSEVATEA